MTTQGIRQFFTASTVSNLAEATHKNPLTGAFLKFSESDDVRDMLATTVFEANRQKSPVVLTELLSEAFVLHFQLRIHTQEDAAALVKTIAGRIGKTLQSESYEKYPELKAVIYGTKGSKVGFYTAQVVFPSIIVNADRMAKLREAVIFALGMQENSDIPTQLTDLDARNLLPSVLVPTSDDGVEVPLSATFFGDEQAEPLNPLAVANMVNKNVKALPAPDTKTAWVLLGMKRAPGKELTAWQEPRKFRDEKKGQKDGGSGKSKGDASKGKEKGGKK
jgi:hypothetical protein